MENILIGWCIAEERSSSIFFPPEPYSLFREKIDLNSKEGVSRCPAVHKAEKNLFIVKSPYSIHLRANKEINNKIVIRPVYPSTEIKEEILSSIIKIEPPDSWVSDNKPLIQIKMPYLFFSDKNVWINQLETSSIRVNKNWSLIQGRFNIFSWQRPLSFAFQWLDINCDFKIKRGDPLFQVFFDTDENSNNFILKKVSLHDDLSKRIRECEGVTSLMRNTNQLMQNTREEGIKLIK